MAALILMAETPDRAQSDREAAIVDRHLPEGYTASPHILASDEAAANAQNGEDLNEESSLLLQGGDIHRDIYKIKARAQVPRRANTFSAPATRDEDDDDDSLDFRQQNQPGGFRRQYLQRQNLQRQLTNVATPVTKDFISFLALYGSFAGEDLADTDDEDADTDAESGQANETRPLLGRRKSTKRAAAKGDAGTTKTFFTLLKAFVGTGIMFLPKAFRNGGILFSSIVLVVVSLATSLCFRLLLQCRVKYSKAGYGELGEAIVSKRFRSVILASITLSQLGFVCSGIIFTAENLESFLRAVTKGRHLPLGTVSLILLQFIVLIPLALIRNISKLGPAALLADVFILIGIAYIWSYDISSLAQYGVNESVRLFNPSAFTLTIGSAIFTFEGIGLILPIQSSMAEPEHFEYLLYLVMVIITVIFTSVGVLCYATFGEFTKIQIISNFPQESPLVNAVQFIYSLAVLVGEPVQLFPAVRIIETTLFGEKATGKKSAAIKWKKNALRTALVCICGVVAILGASDLDKFVALIGSFACVPLVYIYPPFMHWRGVAKTRWEKLVDGGMILVGAIAMAYTSVVTIGQWAQG